MKETQPKTVEQFHSAMRTHNQKMEDVSNSPEHGQLRHLIAGINREIRQDAQEGSLLVITGEQPYGPLGQPKVLGKRILAQAVAETYGDTKTIELFANLDLVGSEPGFYRLVVPTNSTQTGVISQSLLPNGLKEKGATANGIKLPNADILKTLDTIVKNFSTHYPAGSSTPQYGEVLASWRNVYNSDEIANYADSHIQWLCDVEKKLGLELDTVTREQEIDLLIARSGGIEIMNILWKQGLDKLSASGYKPETINLDGNVREATPFNLEQNGYRLKTTYTDEGNSKILTEHPRTKQQEVITIEDALGGSYGFSWKAVPRVMLYSLSGIDGHITGGGSVYNQDARTLLEAFALPYFPIMHMKSYDSNGDTLAVIQYDSLAHARKANQKGKDAVHRGEISLLDFALSSNLAQAKEQIGKKIHQQGGNFSSEEVITIPKNE